MSDNSQWMPVTLDTGSLGAETLSLLALTIAATALARMAARGEGRRADTESRAETRPLP